MGSAIEWTDETWNPTVGCSKVSPGCDNCYAIGVAHRAMQPAHEGLTIVQDGQRPDWTGEVRLLHDRLDTPLRWRKPRRVFVDSMSDLFHQDVPLEFIQRVFTTMTLARQHTFQVLTKRPQRMAAMLGAEEPDFWYGIAEAPPDNIWLGTSIENDRYAWRANYLRRVDCAVRFLSLEPLVGPLPSLDLTGIDWVIVGGESGPGARPMHPQWVRDIRDRCREAGVSFFFKQWGSWAMVRYPDHGRRGDRLIFAGATSWEQERERAMGRWRGQRTIEITRKYGKRQIIPMAPRTTWMVELTMAHRTAGPLFLDHTGERRIDRRAIGRIVDRVVRAAGIGKRITPHSFRHTFVTMALDAGASERDIAASTGHADTRMVAYYDRGRDNIARNATHAVAAWVEGAS